MLFRDERTYGFEERINAIRRAEDEAIIAGCCPAQFRVMGSWLTEQAALMIQQSVRTPAVFDSTVFPQSIQEALQEGDAILSSTLDSHRMLSPGTDVSTLHPMTRAVSQVYCRLWNLPRTKESALMADHVLQTHLESSLAKSLALDARFSEMQVLELLTTRFETSVAFYHGLIDNIPLPVIKKLEPRLQFLPDRNNGLDGLSYPDKHSTIEAYHQAYVEKQKKLTDGSPWLYIQALTKDSSYSQFEEVGFRQSLQFRLPVSRWVRWIDRLYWPLTQAVAMHIFWDPSILEEFLGELVRAAPELSTPYPHLALIAMDRYLHVLHEVSRCLFRYSEPLTHHDAVLLAEIQTKGKKEWDDWKSSGLRTSIARVMDNLFSDRQMVTPSLLRGLFDWVAAQDRGIWMHLALRQPTVLVIDTLYEVFLEKIHREPGLKPQLLQAIESGDMTWPKAKLLCELYAMDKTDTALRDQVVAKHLEWLAKASFSWNLTFVYNDEVISQAHRFAFLIEHGPDPEKVIRLLTHQYRACYEGWPAKLNQQENQGRELFLFMTGGALCFLFLEKGERARVQPLFDEYLQLVLQQYRFAPTTSRDHYCLIIRFLVFVHLKFNLPDFPDMMQGLLRQIDHIEEVIQIAHDWIQTCSFLSLALHPGVKTAILQRISVEYYIIETKIKSQPPPSPIRRYERQYQDIIAAF